MIESMDSAEAAFLSGETVAKPATEGMFDFVNSNLDVHGMKALGVFIEPNNNGQVKPDAAFDHSLFWNDKEGALLDDITPWGEWSDSSKTPCASAESSENSAYTLTVLNSTEQWTKTPDKSKKSDTNLDLESFLNILPDAESDSSSYFYPEYPAYVDPKEIPSSPSTTNNNNNDWKTHNNNHNNNGSVNESLLRNALQGKGSFTRNYGSPCKKDSRDSVAQYVDSIAHYPENGSSDHLDNILGFSPLEHYRDDFEKIKKIANEFDCAKYPIPHCGDMYNPAPSADAFSGIQVVSPSGKCFNKKFSKKVIQNSKASSGSARKERSLHYCSICAKGFKDKYSVNVHVRTHTGEKPFACNLCGKSFRQKAHLAKHYQTHLAQSQKQVANGGGGGAGGTGPSASRPRPKVPCIDSQHR